MSFKKIIIVAAILAVPCARAQEDDGSRAGLSRAMSVAIRFYEQGEDVEAMDRFMEIMTKGDPAERSMANDYLNLISHRMNTGGGAGGNPAPSPRRVRLDSIDAPSPAPAPSLAPAPAPAARGPLSAAPRASPDDDMPASNKAVMRKEIRARLRAAQEKSLSDLKAVEHVRTVMRENGDPEAVGIPSSMLFQAGIAFQRDAGRLLDPLTKLIFALGSTQVLILPEGTALGDAKVLDMRRTMGISAHLFQAGVAPPRVRVNLLNTQVDIPKGLLDFKGVVIVFLYNQPMNLVIESAIGDELGPPISLGVYPQQIRPGRNQGAIFEFSVSDPPAGLVSWKFQLLQPSLGGAESAPLQEIVGGGPVFHQIFWNGRRHYFGNPLPAGRYECVLSALDAKNRSRTLHRWISLLEDAGAPEKLLAAAQPEQAAGTAPSADLSGDESKPLVAGVKPSFVSTTITAPPKSAAPSRRKIVKRPVRAKKSAKADKGTQDKETSPKVSPEDVAAAKPVSPGRYELAFNADTHTITPFSEKTLAAAAAELAHYPLEALKVVGHASSDEKEGAALAERRAKMVAGLLVNRYQIEPKKIQMSSSASGEGAKVEIIMSRND